MRLTVAEKRAKVWPTKREALAHHPDRKDRRYRLHEIVSADGKQRAYVWDRDNVRAVGWVARHWGVSYAILDTPPSLTAAAEGVKELPPEQQEELVAEFFGAIDQNVLENALRNLGRLKKRH